jgi:hypothetical protein
MQADPALVAGIATFATIVAIFLLSPSMLRPWPVMALPVASLR